jgi:hypothetical protein
MLRLRLSSWWFFFGVDLTPASVCGGVFTMTDFVYEKRQIVPTDGAKLLVQFPV